MPHAAQAAIERFLKASRRPVLIEPGEEPIQLNPDHYLLELRGDRLLLQAWDEARNLARRVLEIGSEQPGRLDLVVEHFGKRTGAMWLIDQDQPKHRTVTRHGTRLVFRERFRRFLARQFAGWKIAELSTEPDLTHSLSPSFPRALVKKGGVAWAAIGAGPDGPDPAGALTFGLIWLDYLRRREPRLTLAGLTLLVPADGERTLLQRLRYLDSRVAAWKVFVYSEEGFEAPVDPADYGNLSSELSLCHTPAPAAASDLLGRVLSLPGVEAVSLGDGSLSLRVHGLEFAAASGDGLVFGLHEKRRARQSDLAEIEQLTATLGRLRSPTARDRLNPLYLDRPERWLESAVRTHLERIDATLLPSPVYGQVPAVAGGERGVIDLVAAERSGRLAVLELKAAEDVHLPLQALDYWMRVKWHLDRAEFSPRGYFPGLALSPVAPRLLLIAPALDFHPTTETILRFFSPDIEVERIGLGVEWKKLPQVMFRMRGAQRPG